MIGCEKATDSGVRDSFANRWRLGARVAGPRKCREIPHDPSWRFDAFGVPTVVLFLESARVNATKAFFRMKMISRRLERLVESSHRRLLPWSRWAGGGPWTDGRIHRLGGLKAITSRDSHCATTTRESFAHLFLAGVRSIPPIAHACLQISAFLAICWLSKCVDSTARSHSFEKIAIGSVDSCDC